MKYHLLQLHVNQCDETPVQVINDGPNPGSKSYMWVHRSGELYRDTQIALYEYQKGRDHHLPLEYYKDFQGVLVTDGLQQYHLVDKKLEGLTNANCWAHARRDYSDAVKAAEGLNYSINQERYLRVFLNDGEVPIDNSASERAIRTFCVGKKNWLFFDSITGAEAGAAVYSKTETAKLNNLHPYRYLEYLITRLANLKDEDGNFDTTKLDSLMPWASEIPKECRKPIR